MNSWCSLKLVSLLLVAFAFGCSLFAADEADKCKKTLGAVGNKSPFLRAYEAGQDRIAYENQHWFVLFDRYPSRPGHALIIPKRQFESYFEINPEEWQSLTDAMKSARKVIGETNMQELYDGMSKSPSNEASQHFVNKALKSEFLKRKANDFTIAVNEGPHAGRTVDHLHIHMIPRFEGDVKDPTGGIRHMFPGDGNYLAMGYSMNALDAASRYYNHNDTALAYFRKIREVRGVMEDLLEWEKNFPEEARILEVGFGPGIEFEYLVKKGLHIDGLDISEPMKIQLERLLDKAHGYGWREHGNLFPYSLQEFNPGIAKYDRIWAMATFLHVDKHELAGMITKYGKALKPKGEFFVNFKVGEGPTRFDSEGRPFTYFTEETFKSEIMKDVKGLAIKKSWTTGVGDDKLGRSTQWLSFILVPKD